MNKRNFLKMAAAVPVAAVASGVSAAVGVPDDSLVVRKGFTMFKGLVYG